MRIFTLRRFAKDAAKSGIGDDLLREAVHRAESGLIDANLGLCLIKQRLPRQGQGRSGGYRTILFHKRGERAVFLYVFPKNARANITADELEGLREFAGILANLEDEAFDRASREQGWKVVTDDEPEEDVPK